VRAEQPNDVSEQAEAYWRANANRGFQDAALFEVGQIFAGEKPEDQSNAASGVRTGAAILTGGGRRWDGARRAGRSFGQIVDLSAGGVRIRTEDRDVRADNQIRVRMELPDYAGISPFIDTTEGVKPKREWVGWMAVTRVAPIDGKTMDVAGKLVDMDEIDRGMLGLYLSTQPLAA
jgi:hypothetical protein